MQTPVCLPSTFNKPVVPDEGFGFIVEWYDPPAELIRRYQLVFFLRDNAIELYDPKNKRLYLKRHRVDNVNFCDLYIGNTIDVLSRPMKIVDYSDESTLKRLTAGQERTLGLMFRQDFCKLGRVLDSIWKSGLRVINLKTLRLSNREPTDVYDKTDPHLSKMMENLTDGPVLAIEMIGENAVRRWRLLLGTFNPNQTGKEKSDTVASQIDTDCVQNAFYGSSSSEDAKSELDLIFGPDNKLSLQNLACFTDCTCGVIKPHIVLHGNAGEIITRIQDCGYEISTIAMHTLDRPNAEEFLEVYRGVVQEYPSMVTEFCCGPCVAMEIRGNNVQQSFREFTGPADPEIARLLRPQSLRSLYGKTKVQNAVHCTDLPEDAVLEVEYFFKVLDS